MIATSFSIATIIFAMVSGLGPERVGAVILALTTLLCFGHEMPEQQATLDVTVCTWANLIGLAGFLTISMRAWRLWPLWAAAVQLLAAMGAIAFHFRLINSASVLCSMQDLAQVMSTLIVFLGTFAIWLGRRRYAALPSWRDWIGPNYR